MEDDLWKEYSRRKMEWLRNHPEATPAEIEEFCKALAKELGI